MFIALTWSSDLWNYHNSWSLSRMLLRVWCQALAVTTASRQDYRSCTGFQFDVGWISRIKMATLVYLSLSGISLSSRRLTASGLRWRSSSAAFCHIKDVRWNVQQLWRQVFRSCSCGTAFVTLVFSDLSGYWRHFCLGAEITAHCD